MGYQTQVLCLICNALCIGGFILIPVNWFRVNASSIDSNSVGGGGRNDTLHHVTYDSCAHRCHRSSQMNHHTSRPGGCIGHFHTGTLLPHMRETLVAAVGWSHATPGSLSYGTSPRRCGHHSHLHRCIRNVWRCTVRCGRQILFPYTSCDL